MKYVFVLLLACCAHPLLTAQENSYLLAGTYTNKGSKGIYVYRFNTLTAEATPVSTTAAINPSFLAVSPDQRFVYAVGEADTGMISAYRFDTSSGQLTLLNRQVTNGRNPCYVSTDYRGRWIFAGNYSSGNFCAFAAGNDGLLTPAIKTVQHYGSSINTQRQQSPHVHATVFAPGSLYVTDLGTDEVKQYGFYWKDGLKDSLPRSTFRSKPGSGPRHLAFHPNFKTAYLMEELSGTVAVLKRKKNGALKLKQRISSHPAGYTGVIGSADIHVSPDGKFLYASNRGESNSIAIFSINQRNGKISLVGHQSTLGKKPRNFNFDPSGNFLLVANQDSDEIVIFKRDLTTGMLTDTGKRISVPTPVCLKWIENKFLPGG
jgi:6-phosphogluconolactonase